MATKLRICVIGAGSCGLGAAKACLEEELDVVVYEKTSNTGGLWRYHDDDSEGVASVTKTTVINTSKEMNAFSDFPPPPEFPNFMHNTKMVKYFELYAEKFGVNKCIKFRHQVVNCEPNDDYESTGKWKIRVHDLANNAFYDEIFDGVMVCSGHHVSPIVPEFPDQNKFKGKTMHTHSYKTPAGFEDMNVVVVGIGNSGGDAVVELSTVAKNVYLSTRRGAWIVNRVGPNGCPFDVAFLTRAWNVLFGLMPYNMRCSFAESYVNKRFDHSDYQMKPKHRIFEQHVAINDYLPNKIISGTVVVKGNIQRFTENGVIFEGDDKETLCDAVVFATGYRISFPFIPQSIVSTQNNKVSLYKYAFPPNLSHPNTLAIIGLIQPIGPIFPIAELQSRWFALLMANKLKLPSREAMLKDIECKRNELESRYYNSSRHTVEVDWIPFMDELGSIIGVKPNLFKYMFTDRELWSKLFFGPAVPYQFRLDGPHAWSGARKAILEVYERVNAPYKTRFPKDKHMQTSISNEMQIFYPLLVCLILIAFGYFSWF